jgi:hypothetical protein
MIELEDRAAIYEASLDMATQARQHLSIYSRDLDSALYSTVAFYAEVKRLGLRSTPFVPVRILVLNPEQAVRTGHYLLELAQRISSRVQILSIPEAFAEDPQAYLLADECGYIRRPLADVYAAVANYHDPMAVRLLAREFTAVWQQGREHPALRRLLL